MASIREGQVGDPTLRSRPPFTGVLRGPGLKVPHGVLFEQFWAPASECPKECFFECFWAFFGPKKCQKALRKHSLGHSEAGAQICSNSTPWGTFRPGLGVFSPHLQREIAETNFRRFRMVSPRFSSTFNGFRAVFCNFQ